MICPTPKVAVLKGNATEVLVGFFLDAVNLQSNYTKLTMIPNPEFKPFDGVHVLKGDSLILEVLFIYSAFDFWN